MQLMNSVRSQFDRERIAAFCRRHRIRRLALFGSVLRNDFGPDSDVDVLVEFEPGAKTGLAFFGMQDELSEIMGRKVDLNTPGFLGSRIRDRVLHETQDVYVAP
jgi:predicted nucleotidyltransferase